MAKVRAMIPTGICTMPPENLSLTQLYDFFERKDRYDIADMFLHIKNFHFWENFMRKYSDKKDRVDGAAVSYAIKQEKYQVILYITFESEEALGRFKEMAPRSSFKSLQRIEN